MLPVRTRRSAGLFIITLSMLLALVVAAPVAAKNPAGNNGTVKIDGLEWDNHPNNEPHVGCTFEVDFYGFDEGDLWADVIFEAHPPTGHGVLLTDTVFIGGDDNSGGGSEAGWDASRQYDLTAALSALPGPSAAGIPRQADDPRRWFAGCGHQAQGLLGGTLRDRYGDQSTRQPAGQPAGEPAGESSE